MESIKHYNSIIKSTKNKINTLEKLEDPSTDQLQEHRKLVAELKCARAQKKQVINLRLKEEIKNEIMSELLPIISDKAP